MNDLLDDTAEEYQFLAVEAFQQDLKHSEISWLVISDNATSKITGTRKLNTIKNEQYGHLPKVSKAAAASKVVRIRKLDVVSKALKTREIELFVFFTARSILNSKTCCKQLNGL